MYIYSTIQKINKYCQDLLSYVKSPVTHETKAYISQTFILLSLLFAFISMKINIIDNSISLIGTNSDFLSYLIYYPLLIILIPFILFDIKQLYKHWFVYLITLALLFINSIIITNEYKFTYLANSSYIFILLSIFFIVKDKYLNFKYLAITLACVEIIQLIVGILQFYMESSVGLKILGESQFKIFTDNFAKLYSDAGYYIRVYGTLPHANILGGVLVICSIFNLYLLNKNIHKYLKIAFSLLYIITAIVIGLTFSRNAILAYIISTTIFLTLNLFKYSFSKNLLAIVTVILSIIITTLIVNPLISARLNIKDQSITDRYLYNKAAINMIIRNPISGVGLGNSVLQLNKYSDHKFNSTETQPIHNSYLAIISEWGIVGLATIIAYFWLIYKTFWLYAKTKSSQLAAIISILIAISILGIFDHYPYTYFPFTLLVIIICGISYRHITYDNSSQLK